MNIRAFIGNLRTRIAAASLLLLPLSSCDNVIYDYEGDCTVTYNVSFRYDMNLKWADAFASEVRSVHLYAFDTEGVLVWQGAERITPETAEDYSMPLDLPAGNYRLVAWGGLDNGAGSEESFSVPDMQVGESRIEELTCRLNSSETAAGAAYSDNRLHPLFHGMLDVELPVNEDGGRYDYTMTLTKNTNHVRVILVHLSGEGPDVEDFTFSIEDENGLMSYDNSLLPDRKIVYRPWNVQNSSVDLGNGDGPEGRASVVPVNGAIADLTVGRMMADHQESTMLTISNKDGEEVARVPLIQYALLSKEYYEKEYRKMDDQEFLDREDEYVLTFFLDANDKWIDTYILIHSWHIVLNDNIELN